MHLGPVPHTDQNWGFLPKYSWIGCYQDKNEVNYEVKIPLYAHKHFVYVPPHQKGKEKLH